jgi:tRNA C32,U32 (ribose-2'-O)-methylase TrmJ
LIHCEHLRVGYAGRAILPPMDLDVERGEFWAIVGRNGNGKTTLFRTLLGLLPAVSGSLRRAPGLRLAYVPQRTQLDPIFPALAREVVAMGSERAWSFARPRLREPAGVMEALERVATTARRRHWNRTMREPWELEDLFRDASPERRLAVVFGPEDDGLSNDDVARCDAVLSIPRPMDMGASLSLPAAATIVAWEIARARGARLLPAPGRDDAFERAKRELTTAELDGFVETVAGAAEGLGLRTQPDAARFRGTLRDFFARAKPTEADRLFLRHLFAQLGKWKRRVREEARQDALRAP